MPVRITSTRGHSGDGRVRLEARPAGLATVLMVCLTACAILGATIAPAHTLPPAGPEGPATWRAWTESVGRSGAAEAPVHRVAVFGRDDRGTLPGELADLGSTVGLLYSQRARALCSAFCVGDDVIATAAHCFFRTAQEPLPPVSDFVFRRESTSGHRQSRIAGLPTATRAQFILAGSMRLSIRPPIEASRDWALARLAEPVCRGHVLKLKAMPTAEIARLAGLGRMFQIAYHRDWTNTRPAFSRQCDVTYGSQAPQWEAVTRDFADPENLILHTCDTGGASSGSPLFVETADGPVVVGINVGTYVQSKVALRGGEVVQRYRAQDIANTGVNVIALADKLGTFSRAPILATSTRIKSLQGLLRSRADYRGSLDGTYGPKLKVAIEDYERSQNLPVTGLATETLLKRLADRQPSTVLASGEAAGQRPGAGAPNRSQRKAGKPSARQRTSGVR